MALDWSRARAQLEQLSRALDETEALKGELTAYRRRLNQAWSAGEISYLNRTIDDLTARCGQLSRELERLRRDMERAMEDIRAEEEAQAAAAAAEAEG